MPRDGYVVAVGICSVEVLQFFFFFFLYSLNPAFANRHGRE